MDPVVLGLEPDLLERPAVAVNRDEHGLLTRIIHHQRRALQPRETTTKFLAFWDVLPTKKDMERTGTANMASVFENELNVLVREVALRLPVNCMVCIQYRHSFSPYAFCVARLTG
jgi:hypothetical protein